MLNVPAAREKVPVYVLAGGRSSRFGSDKARALFDGRPLLLQVVEALRPLAESVTAVADVEDKYRDLGLRTIVDRAPGQGPLGGLQAALLDADRPEWLLLSSCDWVGLKPEWVELLLQGRDADLPAVAFKGDVWQPLLALYHRSLRAEVAARLADKRLALWRLLRDAPARALALPPGWDQVRQVNRPDDLDPAGR
jgi:molybdenum cofactor guanylyltransferase